MLSINIPVYNVEVVELVKQLHKQASELNIGFEIRVYDDGSDEIFRSINKSVSTMKNVLYREMGENIGRAAIRNRMGFDSRFKLLLFMDADSKVTSATYLKKFIDNYGESIVLCGGTSYSKDKPAEDEKLLRWTYGHKREAVSAKQRNNSKGFIITSNNFLIDKNTFESVNFREELRKYGHEDTLLGYDLFHRNFQILHIDNPLEHTGLESAQVFLKKTRLALENLRRINEEFLGNDGVFCKQVNFLDKFYKITRIIPVVVLSKIYNRFKEKLEANLRGKKPMLLLYDLYKIAYYASIKNR